MPDGGPRILLCTAGSALVRAAGGARARVLGAARPCGWPADDRDVTLVAQEPGTQLFLAGDGLDI